MVIVYLYVVCFVGFGRRFGAVYKEYGRTFGLTNNNKSSTVE